LINDQNKNDQIEYKGYKEYEKDVIDLNIKLKESYKKLDSTGEDKK